MDNIHFIIRFVSLLQRNLYQRFKSKYSEDTSGGDKSIVNQNDSTIKANKLSFVEELHAEKSTKVDATNSLIETTVPVQKSDSDEGDIEVISKEQLDDMADMQNGTDNSNEGDGTRRFSVSEETEANDKFPQQITNKSANWNTMELGEKRKRLR